MMFTDAYTVLSNAVVNTVGSVDPNILNQMGLAAFGLQTITTGLNKAWLQTTGWNPTGNPNDPAMPAGPNIIRITNPDPKVGGYLYFNLLSGMNVTPPNVNPGVAMKDVDVINILACKDSDFFHQLSETGVQQLQGLVSTLVGNDQKQTESGFANTIFSRVQSTLQLQTSDPSSLAQQMTSSMNQFSGQPAADVDIFTQGSGVWNSVGSLTQSSF